MFKKILMLTSLAFMGHWAFAQTGSIKVKVFDDETGESIIGATAVIQGTTNGAITDFDGNATIRSLAAGDYTIEVSFVSYQKQTIENIVVNEGEATVLGNIRMSVEMVGLEEVVVQAEAIRSSESALLAVQRKSAKVFDAISSDMFAINGDSEAASAVKRVVGVTVESGKYVYVRGLGDRYSKATLNGADIPGLDPDRNSVQMDLFPSNLIENIVVYKTFTPDLTGDFSGGLVDVSTKDFPDEFTMQASGSLGFNSQTTFNSNVLTHEGSGTDWLGFDNGTRDLPTLFSDYSITNYPSTTTVTPEGGAWPVQEIEQFTQAFENREFTPNTFSPKPNHSLSFSMGDLLPLGTKEIGIIGGLTYNRNTQFYKNGIVNRWQLTSTDQESLNQDQTVQYDDSRAQEETNWGALVKVAMKLNNNNKVSINALRNQSGTKETRVLQGAWNSGRFGVIDPDGPNDTSTSRVLSWTDRALSNFELAGEHVLSENGIKVEWISSYTISGMDQPDLRFLRSNFDFTNQLNQMVNKDRPSRFYRSMDEVNWDNKLHVSIPVTLFADKEGKVKLGGAYTTKDREFREDIYNYNLSFNSFDGDIDKVFSNPELAIDDEGNLTGSTLEIVSAQMNNYDGDQTIVSGYAMIETPVSEKLKLTTGLRVEQTDQKTVSFDDSIDPGELSETSLLPAFNLTYELVEKTNLRFSYTNTIARPSFREFAPFSSFGFRGGNIINGNPNLELTNIQNLDIRFEKFPGIGEYIGISGFYKKLENPIELTFSAVAAESDPQFTYNNVPEATLLGAEFEFRKSLDFISESLQNYKINANVSIIYSQVNISAGEYSVRQNYREDAKNTREMFNQSPYVANASFIYQNQETGWNWNLGFNVFGPRLKLIRADFLDVTEKPRPELNWSISKRLNDRWSARFRAKNLLNPDIKQTIQFNGKELDFNNYTNGRTFSVSLTYKFEKF